MTRTQHPVLAHRQPIHGPLWTAEDGQTHVQLWAPNDRRDHWALHWTTTDEDGEVVDSGYRRTAHVGEFPAITPANIRRPVGAVLNAATIWNPQEQCDHTRARSFSVIDGGRHVCGYCGRIFQPRAI